MYILQLSDLHVSSAEELDTLKEKITILGKCLSNCVPQGSQIICCILGDFVDKGNASLYPVVRDLLTELQNELLKITEKDNIAITIVPGNHDLCPEGIEDKKTLNAFNQFASETISDRINYSDEKSILEEDYFDYHLINISTVLNSIHQYGTIDYGRLDHCSFPANTIVLTHHSLISGDSDDDAVIRNGYKLQKYLEERNVIALLHGHTHGCKRYTVGTDCQVIGVGPMFKAVPDVSNQCNLVHIKGNSVRKITTLIYQDDRKVWDSVDTYVKDIDNNYNGSSVYDVYTRVLRDAEANLLLPNLKIQIKQKFDSFAKEIGDHFASYMERAQIWLKNGPDDSLEYTHGQLMTYRGVNWDQFICDTLKRNPTSKRAMVPLIDKDMVFKGGDGKLVSFDIVQMGFSNADSKDLHITVYLRALEVFNFLPINICEVFLMARTVKEYIQSIDSVTICFFAYRAEIKKKYGCYSKTQIDSLRESELCKILWSKEYARLKELLIEKANVGETVIEFDWLDKVKNALENFYEGKNKSEVMQQVEEVRRKLGELKDIRTRCSDYSQTQQYEDRFTDALLTLSSMLLEVENE